VPDQAPSAAGGKVRPRHTALCAGVRQEAPPPDVAAPGAVGAGLAQIPFKIRLGRGSLALFLPTKEKGWGKKGERKGRVKDRYGEPERGGVNGSR
jgi:hypothetical protein